MQELLDSENKQEEAISEGLIPVEIGMTLDRIIADGKCSDSVSHTVLAYLAKALREGNLTLLASYSSSAPEAGLVAHIRELDDKEAVKLATALKLMLESKAFEQENNVFNPQRSTVDWIRFVLAKQD